MKQSRQTPSEHRGKKRNAERESECVLDVYVGVTLDLHWLRKFPKVQGQKLLYSCTVTTSNLQMLFLWIPSGCTEARHAVRWWSSDPFRSRRMARIRKVLCHGGCKWINVITRRETGLNKDCSHKCRSFPDEESLTSFCSAEPTCWTALIIKIFIL